MNLLIRLIILLISLKNQPKPNFLATIHNQYRILPHDMGFRDHVPNYRYLSFIELNIIQWLNQQSPQKHIKWVISAQQMTYLKQVKIFAKINVNSQLLGWNEKYLYFHHEFSVNGQLVAVALTKIVLTLNNKTIAPQIIVDTPIRSHAVIDSWQDNQTAIKNLEPIANRHH